MPLGWREYRDPQPTIFAWKDAKRISGREAINPQPCQFDAGVVVRDRDGQGGWVHYSLLSGVRHVIVEADLTPMRVKPDAESPVNAYVEAGVVARLEDCSLDWCMIEADSSKGWVEKRRLWGVKPEEVRD